MKLLGRWSSSTQSASHGGVCHLAVPVAMIQMLTCIHGVHDAAGTVPFTAVYMSASSHAASSHENVPCALGLTQITLCYVIWVWKHCVMNDHGQARLAANRRLIYLHATYCSLLKFDQAATRATDRDDIIGWQMLQQSMKGGHRDYSKMLKEDNKRLARDLRRNQWEQLEWWRPVSCRLFGTLAQPDSDYQNFNISTSSVQLGSLGEGSG